MTITCDISTLEFKAIKEGKQNFYILKSDRPFDIGDTLLFHEQNEDKSFTGEEQSFEITYIIGNHRGLKPEYKTLGWYKQKEL